MNTLTVRPPNSLHGQARHLALGGLLLSAVWGAQGAPAGQESFSVEDYFRIRRVTELSLSSTASRLAFAVESPVLTENRVDHAVYLSGLERNAQPTAVPQLAGGHDLAWIPGSDRLAFISGGPGGAGVSIYDAKTKTTERATASSDPIIRFHLAPDGLHIAYETAARANPATPLYQRFRDGGGGILVDSDTVGIHDFINPNAVPANPLRAVDRRLWIGLIGHPGAEQAVAVPGAVTEFLWSPDSTRLSVTYVADDTPASTVRSSRTSVGVVDAASSRFRPLWQAQGPAGGRPGVWYAGGEWTPKENQILVRRFIQQDLWVSPEFPEWTVRSASAPGDGVVWHSEETYHARYFPLGDGSVLVENTVRARSSLFLWTPQGSTPAKVVAGLGGSSSLFAFGADPECAVFVNESMTRPPEIFVRWGAGQPARQLTHLNAGVARTAVLQASEINWTSTDGTVATGWLMVPNQPGHHGPWPLVTMVHGGPQFPFTDAFAPYFYYWPFPLDAYAAHGMAVFVPHYRGTASFGRKYQSPIDDGGEPVEDVISGVKNLIATGVADPQRLGISGQSRGALLGPLALTRLPIFRASSFAEGTSNQVVNYELLDGLSDRDVHDVEDGASLYASPQRYLDLSPDLHFDHVRSANLFEAGAWSQAVEMLGFAKVSRHFGLPTELVIYPRTAHNPNSPLIQRESAQRNLDWFLFWLQGYERTVPASAGGETSASLAAQYARWRALRQE